MDTAATGDDDTAARAARSACAGVGSDAPAAGGRRLSLAFLWWIVLLFPVWVCVASVYELVAELGANRTGSHGGAR